MTSPGAEKPNIDLPKEGSQTANRYVGRQMRWLIDLLQTTVPDLERHPDLCPMFADVVISECTVLGARACIVASPPYPTPVLAVGANRVKNCTCAEWVELKIHQESLAAVDIDLSDLTGGTTLRFEGKGQVRKLHVKGDIHQSISYTISWQFPGDSAGSGSGGGADMAIQDPP